MQLLPYQIPARDNLVRVLKNYPAALDASQTGTGKTYVAIAAAKELNLRPGIVCPKSVIPAWRRVCEEAGITPLFIRNYEALKTLKYELKSKIDGIRKAVPLAWDIPVGSLVIFDEAHRCKGVDTINAKMAIAAASCRLKVLCLSATVASNPMEMNALGQLLNLHQGWNFWKWCRKNGCINAPWGGLMYVGGTKALKKIHSQIFPERGTRIRIQDLGDAFPETLITAETYDIDDKKLTQIYQDMQKELESLHLRTRDGKSENTPLTILLRARQQAELLKVPTLCELCEDAVAEGNSVAIFVNFTDTLRSLSERLRKNHPTGEIHGEQSAAEREAFIQGFQENRTRVIICNIAAGGVGISLHDLSGQFPRVSLISPGYSAIQIVQALGRIHRAGAKSKAVQKIVFAAGCVEEEACKAVKKKINNINTLTDGNLKEGIKFI